MLTYRLLSIARQGDRIGFIRGGATLAGLGLAVWLAWLTVQIRAQSTVDEARPADVIVVMGAAEYRGKPSPVLKARLDHGLSLYERKLAPRILTTGGAGGDPVFTEGTVGRNYLISKGVPSESIVLEDEGATTVHSVVATAEIMTRMGLSSCILVSDGYHIFRAKKLLESRGIRVYGSPRAVRFEQGWGMWWLYFRQAAAYVLWRVGVPI
ncbi:MAG TPA: YdcF family protein [Bryobacteraceae bacterium]|nr:YdcF family protein [Bryobacteraceae bacterium]